MSAMRDLLAIVIFLALGTCAYAASSPPPNDFAGVSFGTTLRSLKNQYPAASRNPDSDRAFQVYQVSALRGIDPKSAAAFSILHGRVVGGQILLDQRNTDYWFDAMKQKYGTPDSCTYCNDPMNAVAVWRWPNGTSLKIDGGMLTELTSAGNDAREKWLARGDSGSSDADNGDEESDMAEAGEPAPKAHHAHAPRQTTTVASGTAPSKAPDSGWEYVYQGARKTVHRWVYGN
jgi:hypothetical protein